MKLAALVAAGAPLVGCTWGNYDGNLGAFDAGLGGGTGTSSSTSSSTSSGTPISASGGRVTSDDGLFEVTFPPGSVDPNTVVFISGSAGPPSFCAVGVSCWSSAYLVVTSGSDIHQSIGLHFNLAKSGFNAPQAQAFLVAPGPQALPGVWPSDGSIEAVQSADIMSSALGPYAVVNAPGTVPHGPCGMTLDVCGPCALNCCAAASMPSPAGGVGESCMCTGGDLTCLMACVDSGEQETCP